jgi:hypothetical protein
MSDGQCFGGTPAITRLEFSDGTWVSVFSLDQILRQVADLNLSDNALIKKELLERVKASNYLPRSAEEKYAEALFNEYKSKNGKSEKDNRPDGYQVNKHSSG